jgi:hypothetical protein
VDPVRRQELRHKKEESRFHVSGNGSDAFSAEADPVHRECGLDQGELMTRERRQF